jgi:hypothetical protein
LHGFARANCWTRTAYLKSLEWLDGTHSSGILDLYLIVITVGIFPPPDGLRKVDDLSSAQNTLSARVAVVGLPPAMLFCTPTVYISLSFTLFLLSAGMRLSFLRRSMWGNRTRSFATVSLPRTAKLSSSARSLKPVGLGSVLLRSVLLSRLCSSSVAVQSAVDVVHTVGVAERAPVIAVPHTMDETFVRKRALDERDYKSLTLDNGLRVLLVSDPKSNRSAAAIDVNVGYFSDPKELPGLAHFCEHMSFLGTKKYPQEEEFSTFLAANGGSSNAYTDSEDTVYVST